MAQVSICIPTYNNASDVDRLLDSISEQTYTDYEVIITDDSTNDEIAELVKEKAPDARYIHNENKLGHIFNWNEAISLATGDYVKIMFSDDWFTFPDSLEKMVRLLDDTPDASMVFTGSRQVQLDSDDREYRDRCATEEFIRGLKSDYRLLFSTNQIGAPSATMYRRDDAIRFDEKSNWASDVFLYFEILGRNSKFTYSTEPLISIGEHKNQYTESFTSNDKRIFYDYRYMYRKYSLSTSDMCKNHYKEVYLHPYMKECIKRPCRQLRDLLLKRK